MLFPPQAYAHTDATVPHVRPGSHAASVSGCEAATTAIQSRPDSAPATVDIFLRQTDGRFTWVAVAETFALARQKVVQNPASSDYAFLIVDSTSGENAIVEPSEKPPEQSSRSLNSVANW